MTTREASKNYNVPVRRIRRAIARGRLRAVKMDNGRWTVADSEMENALAITAEVVREDRTFRIAQIEKLRTIGLRKEVFATQAAADQFAEMLDAAAHAKLKETSVSD